MAQRWWQEPPPAAGYFVMATGILSIGLHLTDFEVPSVIALMLAAAVWVVLAVDFASRLLWSRERWEAEADTPAALTGVAATTVLGTRLALLGWQATAAALLILAVVLWPVLLHAVLRHWGRALPGAAFLVCVSTQGCAVLAVNLAIVSDRGWLVPVALVFWCFGLALYTAASFRFDIQQIWTGAGDQWVATGALAISTLAASKLVAAHHWTGTPQTTLCALTLALLTLNLIGYAILMAAEIASPRYDIRRWATVFPLGMTAVATISTATTLNIPWLRVVGDCLLLVAIGAWMLTFLALIADRKTFETSPPD